MRKIFFITMILLLTIVSNAQKKVKVTITNVYVEDDKIFLDYDILNANKTDFFDITMLVSHTDGAAINANTVSGDIGKKISAGKNKTIQWDFVADNIFLDENINIQLRADPVIKTIADVGLNKLLIANTLLPGKAIFLLDNSKNYIYWSIAGYSAIAGAFATNRFAKSAYNQYMTVTVYEDRENYYTKSKNFGYASKFFTLTAVTIWATNYYRIFSINKHNQGSTYTFRFYPQYDYFTKTNLVSIGFYF